MFRRLSNFRKKDRGEHRLLRFHRTQSEPQNSKSSPSSISEPTEGDQDSLTVVAHSSPPTSTSSSKVQSGSYSEAGPLGLTVVYTPENARKTDIVFIHGLGGTSRWTWSKDRDPELFWPAKFLPFDSDVCLARILTFGYNANFLKAGSIGVSLLDFAKDLLFNLKYASDNQDADLNIGNVPLIFIVHSMGGLIIKEAYIQGQNDPEYQSIIKAISAIIFLATPHRGTYLAETLNRILQTTIVTNPKPYISDLVNNSFTLQRLNEQFRHIASRLDIVSFYETQPTSFVFKRIIVVEKDSAILGYPGEISKPLNADHHGVCKYQSPNDPDYIAVRNVLKSLLRKTISRSNPKKPILSIQKESQGLRSFLAITETPTVDYSFFRDQWAHGTCNWILQDESFGKWLQAPDKTSSVLWLNGGAATGKSVLSSFVINHLVERDACCQYFFIRFGEQKKRTLGTLLRSIAYQTALAIPEFLQKLLEMADEAIDFENIDSRTIWERVFRSLLFNMEVHKPLYWVIDGLDEAHDPRAIFKFLSDVGFSSIPLRILLVGRRTSEIEFAFQKVPESLRLRTINIEGHLEDIQCYARQELSMPGGPEFKETMVERIVDKSQNNFLWARHAVSELNLCHRRADVERALQELPVGMEAVYHRMALSISQNPSSSNKALALSILQCVTCSIRGLTVAELSQALDEDLSEILDLERSIVDLCGGFLVIDNSDNVTLIHQTAREYLLDSSHPFYVDPGDAHERMFKSCMKCLMTIGLRGKITQNQNPVFVDYASNHWSSHLVSTPPDSKQISGILNKFLTNHWVLTWIHALASYNQQQALIQASKDLSKYCSILQRCDREQPDKRKQIVEQELLESWSIDYVKLVGKFGTHLRRNPESIYKLIPPLCPRNSSIYKIFGRREAKNISVSGISTESWDDFLARISFGPGNFASSIAASGALFGAHAAKNVFMYDSSTFEELVASPIHHGEQIYRIELNSTATLLASYGYKTIKVWEALTGKCRLSVDNITSRSRPLFMIFANNNQTLLVGNEDKRIRSLDLSQQSPAWKIVAELAEPYIEGYISDCASHMAMNKDGTLIAVGHRGYPLSAWEIDGPVHLGHCWRLHNEKDTGDVIDAVWHPQALELWGVYIEGVIFRWSPHDGRVLEMGTGAKKLALSKDGSLLATGDARGTVRVHATSDLSILYQLTSEDTVLGIAFGPDHRRFYDIRGYYANVWEPTSLMKFSEQTDKNIEGVSEAGNFDLDLSIRPSPSRKIDDITVVAASPSGRLYSYGTASGIVYIVDLHKEKVIDVHTQKGSLSIEDMSWSDDGRYVCFSDSGKRICIKSITLDGETSEVAMETKVATLVKNVAKGAITQLLFRPDLTAVLVFTSTTANAISITTLSVTQSVEFDTAEYKWIAHPQDPELVVGFGTKRIQIMTWDLVQIRAYTFGFEGYPDHAAVNRVLVTEDKVHLLIQTSSQKHNSRDKALHYLKSSNLPPSSLTSTDDDQKSNTTATTPISLPKGVSSEIALPLQFYSKSHLTFLSRDSSVYSWKPAPVHGYSSIALISGMDYVNVPGAPIDLQPIDSIIKQSKELFVLPGDWINRDNLSLCAIWSAEKSFLCPRNGEVAIVRCKELS
ncbi:hypothetical protein F4811DRAFT_450319 [Daldinia bambusicola]|nr:hypothetical protein F4811DRAFT_450319 [Daldinia bambusicola]